MSVWVVGEGFADAHGLAVDGAGDAVPLFLLGVGLAGDGELVLAEEVGAVGVGEVGLLARLLGEEGEAVPGARVVDGLAVVPLDAVTARCYARIRADLERKGTPIGANDLWIAAQALALGAVLVTDNEREFSRVGKLTVENWLVEGA